MARYLLIESRDPFESNDVSYLYNLAGDLAAQGDNVSLFLVQNGVLAARKAAQNNPLTGVLNGKVEVLADSLSVQERGIQDADRHPSVKLSDIDSLVASMLEDGTKVLWH